MQGIEMDDIIKLHAKDKCLTLIDWRTESDDDGWSVKMDDVVNIYSRLIKKELTYYFLSDCECSEKVITNGT